MAKKQRGGTTSSSKTQKMVEPTDNFSLMLTSSDDEEPEEVTFEDAKTEALRSMKLALDGARREKELLKERRRKRQELFQEQKKRKLLPADVLEEIDSAPSKKQKESEDEGEAEEDQEGEEESKKKNSKKMAHSRSLKGNYTVTTVRERASASCQQQTAEDFLRSRLYGPGSCRTTSKDSEVHVNTVYIITLNSVSPGLFLGVPQGFNQKRQKHIPPSSLLRVCVYLSCRDFVLHATLCGRSLQRR
uniref:Nucleolar protein 7-like n=1 Tax=Labrus bergylta TaxID=56723 RepID=A0A3Q3GFQ1_9LABR|nr:nucleolar protein 7-like [Labrus bergylta]